MRNGKANQSVSSAQNQTASFIGTQMRVDVHVWGRNASSNRNDESRAHGSKWKSDSMVRVRAMELQQPLAARKLAAEQCPNL